MDSSGIEFRLNKSIQLVSTVRWERATATKNVLCGMSVLLRTLLDAAKTVIG